MPPGCYQEIPDDVVFKVSPQHEHTQLTHVLEQIVADYPAAARRGRAAQRWAAHTTLAAGLRKATARNSPSKSFTIAPCCSSPIESPTISSNWNVTADPCLLHQVDRVMFDLFGRKTPQRRAA